MMSNMNMMGYSPWGNKESDTTEQLILLHNMKGRIKKNTPLKAKKIDILF